MNKKSNLLYGFAGVLILATTFLPAAALAREGEASGVTVSGTISTHVETEDGGDGVSSNASTTARVHEGDENGTSETNQNDTESNTSRFNDGEHQSSKSGHESDKNDNEIEVDQESADNASTTIDSPEHVSNHGELRSFLNHVVKEDNRISDVHVSSSTIETHYEMPAKFLWVIPMNLTADVSVTSDGSVTITYPWYAFFFAKHKNNLAGQLGQSATSTGTTTLSASDQARLLNLLFSHLKTSAEQ